MPVTRRVFTLLVLAGAALLLLGEGGTTLAHANYIRSNPAADARLAAAPTEVRVEFSEAPDPRSSSIQVLDASGTRFDTGPTALSGEPNGLRVALRPLPEAGYLVSWAVVSTIDGHETRGNFAFAVGNASLPALPDIPNAIPAPSAFEIVGRAASFGGVALGLGIVLFGILIRAPQLPDELRRERFALMLAGLLLVIGPGLLALDQGARIPPRLGLVYLTRAIAGVVLAALQTGAARAFFPPGPRRLVMTAAALAAAGSLTVVSHAAANGSPAQVALDIVHVISISAWLGGLAAMLWVVLPSAGAAQPTDAMRLGTIVRRFSLLSIAAVVTLVASGTLASLNRLVLLEDLWETPFGIALLSKIVLVLVAVAIASLNLLRWGPRLRAARSADGARRGLVRGTIAETGLLSVVIVAAGFLTSFPPPATDNGVAFDQTRHAGNLRLELLVPTTQPGRNRFVLRVHEGLTPVTNVEKVILRFTMLEHDMGETDIELTPRAPGEYAGEGSPTAMYGTWQAEAIVRRTGRVDARTVFSIPILPLAGQAGAGARALLLGSYTLVTFLEPPLPSAGAPISLSIVLIDSAGSPVPARNLRATFEGPAATPALDAREVTPGRYVFSIPALNAGTWQATIALGTDGGVKYGFEVRR